MRAHPSQAPFFGSIVSPRLGGRLARVLLVAFLALTVVVAAVAAPSGVDARKSRQVDCAALWSTIVGTMGLSQAMLDQGNQTEAEYYAGVAMQTAEIYAASCMA